VNSSLLVSPQESSSIIETTHPNAPGRFYQTPSGGVYPSVTTILAPHSAEGIQKWRKRVGDEEADRISLQARTRGTMVHLIAEKYLKQEDISTELASLDKLNLRNFKKFKGLLDRISGVRFLEHPLYSDRIRIAGRVDCIADFDGTLSIIDFKTSRRRKVLSYIESYFMQGTAYALMAEERLNLVIRNIAILISVDADTPQVFTGKPKYYYKDLIKYRDLFESTHSIR
jgi:ATP-dependent exoDNAse (exonuclease V) beta subunit